MTTWTIGTGLGGHAREKTDEADAHSWATNLLSALPEAELPTLLGRALLGVGLCGCYGVALGLRGDPASMARGALAIAGMVVTVALLAVPALHVLLALFDVPITPLRTAERASHALYLVGLLLGGLAPAMALYATTANARTALQLGTGLAYLAGTASLVRFTRDLHAAVASAPPRSKLAGRGLLLAFALFSAGLCSDLGASLAAGCAT